MLKNTLRLKINNWNAILTILVLSVCLEVNENHV